MNNIRLGIDIGGTDIKFIVVHGGDVLYKNKIKTAQTAEKIVDDIADVYKKITTEIAVETVGVGTPGGITDGVVDADNLPFKSTPLKKMLEEKLEKFVNIENDANCAALGEIKLGAASGCKNAVLLTLGTGVGGGIIIDGKIYKGANGVGGELGHMIVEVGGKPCPCGFCGCFEQYASATALVSDAKEEAEKNPESILNGIYKANGNTLDGKDVFEAIDKNCPVAGAVLDKYLTYLAAGIDSIYSIFDPEAVILTGGITNKKDIILKGLSKKMRSPLRVEISQLKSDAGSFGAAML